MNSQGLDDLICILNQEYTLPAKGKAYLSALKKNMVAEWLCILACETGQISTEIAAYELGSSYWNEIGLIGGITSGLAYAFTHTYRHGKKHGHDMDVGEAVKYVLSAETGCVLAATSTEYVAVNMSNAPIPYDPAALAFGIGALPLAFIIGLNVMTVFTQIGNTKLGCFTTKKKTMQDMYSSLEKNIQVAKKEGETILEGSHNTLIIEEKEISKVDKYASKEYALYSVHSPLKRYDPQGAEQAFKTLISLV